MRHSAWLVLLCVACVTSNGPHSDASALSRDATTSDARAEDAGDGPGDDFDAEPDGSDDAADCTGQACDLTGPCDGCCVDGLCVAKGLSCGPGMARCIGPSCGAAGGIGEPCVKGQGPSGTEDVGDAGDFVCMYEEWTGCTDTNAICVNDTCVHCGLTGEPCCDNLCLGEAYCNANDRCDSVCGAPGQPCCIDNGALYDCHDGGVCLTYGHDDSAPTCAPGGPCHADGGNCTTCGNQGQSCCGDGGCNVYDGTCTEAGTCFAIHMK